MLFSPTIDQDFDSLLRVSPAKAGIQFFKVFLDSRLRGSDDRFGPFWADIKCE
jgi:hypothetical protein